jgi:PEP-CTERM motif
VSRSTVVVSRLQAQNGNAPQFRDNPFVAIGVGRTRMVMASYPSTEVRLSMRTALLSLLTVLCLMLVVAPAIGDTLYNNGPYNGTNDAWSINFGFSVSESFTVPTGSTIGGFDLVYWDASTSDLLTTVDMQIGSTSFGGSPRTLAGVATTFLGTNQYGYALFQANYSFAGVGWTGAGYVTLSNACSTSGCSVSNPIYWDENSGHSTAYENTLGSIPSEAFTLIGGGCGVAGGARPDCGPPVPEPSSILLFGSGILGLGAVLRKWLF